MTCESIVIRFKAENGKVRVLTATGDDAETFRMIWLPMSALSSRRLTETFENAPVYGEYFTDDHVAGEKP
jgi:hypothetical protein